MSCICIILFACQHTFRTNQPLPQFLPSARHAYCALETHINESLQSASAILTSKRSSLSLVYAFAEQEAMLNMVNTMEELLDLTGHLFGTDAWFVAEEISSGATTPDEEGRGWYSMLKREEIV